MEDGGDYGKIYFYILIFYKTSVYVNNEIYFFSYFYSLKLF